jgi:phosphate transport system substrate-binding protein
MKKRPTKWMMLKKRLNPARLGIVVCFALFTVTCGRQQQVERITIKGSDTEVNLVLHLAEVFMDQHPGVSLSIAGGGSGVGIAALMNGKTDIANSSREITPEEISFALQRGVRIVPNVFAADALVIVTHPAVGVDSLTMEQLGKIFSGKISDWSAVGGKPGRISLYGRQSNSGTFLYFREKVVGRDFSPKLKQMNGTAQIIEAIKHDIGGIGYVGLGYVTRPDGALRAGLRIVQLKATGTSPALSPLHADGGKYPLLRPLYQFTDGGPSKTVQAFFEFEASPQGQRIILENGYLPVQGLFVQDISTPQPDAPESDQ